MEENNVKKLWGRELSLYKLPNLFSMKENIDKFGNSNSLTEKIPAAQKKE